VFSGYFDPSAFPFKASIVVHGMVIRSESGITYEIGNIQWRTVFVSVGHHVFFLHSGAIKDGVKADLVERPRVFPLALVGFSCRNKYFHKVEPASFVAESYDF
jgi:hypothetical protein